MNPGSAETYVNKPAYEALEPLVLAQVQPEWYKARQRAASLAAHHPGASSSNPLVLDSPPSRAAVGTGQHAGHHAQASSSSGELKDAPWFKQAMAEHAAKEAEAAGSSGKKRSRTSSPDPLPTFTPQKMHDAGSSSSGITIPPWIQKAKEEQAAKEAAAKAAAAAASSKDLPTKAKSSEHLPTSTNPLGQTPETEHARTSSPAWIRKAQEEKAAKEAAEAAAAKELPARTKSNEEVPASTSAVEAEPAAKRARSASPPATRERREVTAARPLLFKRVSLAFAGIRREVRSVTDAISPADAMLAGTGCGRASSATPRTRRERDAGCEGQRLGRCARLVQGSYGSQ